jgi:hypothetical protein
MAPPTCNEIKCAAFMLYMGIGLGEKTGKPMANAAQKKWTLFPNIRRHEMFFLERLKASISSSSSKLKYALLSPNLMFMKPSYGMVDFLSNVKSQSSHFDSFNSFTCFTSACHPIVVTTKNASRQRWKFLWCVYKHENWKNNTKTHRFVLLPRHRHPPKRVTGSNSPGSGPQRSEPEKKTE